MTRIGTASLVAEEFKKMDKKAIRVFFSRFQTASFDGPAGSSDYDDSFYVNLQSFSEDELLLLHRYSNWLAPSVELRNRYNARYQNLTDSELLFLVQCGSLRAKRDLFARLKDLNRASDEMLVLMIKDGVKEAKDVLSKRYVQFVKQVTNRLYRNYYFRGIDEHDLFQEGMIGLTKAAQDFNICKRTRFEDFTKYVIIKRIRTLVIRSRNYKNRALNRSFSYHSPIGDSDITFEQLLKGHTFQPEKSFLVDETGKAIVKRFTKLESLVFDLYVDDYSYKEISDKLGVNKKVVDNAIQRIKKKGKAYNLFILNS